ncbi:hypothetical protein FOCC_FOCC014682 [Frankliniella occidentalis]|nr:hypothetical protein FOCC_FOCC014682 [Frankliniella occidentalis]
MGTQIIQQAIESGSTYIEKVHDLVIDYDDMSPQAIYDPEVDDTDFQLDPNDRDSLVDGISFKYKQDAVAYWRNDGKKRKFSSVKNRFSKLSQESLLYRWEKQINDHGTYRDKLKTICSHTYEQYTQAKNNHKIVHDVDLKRWALKKARDLQCNQFKASDSWVYNFKKHHRIVSRKITKFVSKKEVRDREAIKDLALDFVINAIPLVEEYGPDRIVNTDQSGFQLEIHAGRTLADKGSRKVEIIAQKKNAKTTNNELEQSLGDMDSINSKLAYLESDVVEIKKQCASNGTKLTELSLNVARLLRQHLPGQKAITLPAGLTDKIVPVNTLDGVDIFSEWLSQPLNWDAMVGSLKFYLDPSTCKK